VLGGPIVKNKAFFFLDYEGFRQTRKQVSFFTIPTPDERRGILGVPVRDPITGATYPAGTPIPMTPFAAKVLSGLPDPTRPGSASNFELLQTFQNHNDKMGAKVDVQLSPRLNAFARFGYRDVDIYDQPPLPLPSGGSGNGFTYVRNLQVAGGLTFTPGPTQLLEFRLGVARTEAGKNPPALGEPSAQEDFGITGLPSDPRVAGGLPTQLISGYQDLGRQATNPQWQYPTLINPKLNYTRTLGRHSVKTGIEYQNVQTEVQDVNPLYGRDEYAGRFSRPTGSTSTDNRYNLADFMFWCRFAMKKFVSA